MIIGSEAASGLFGFVMILRCAYLRKIVRSKWAFRRVEWIPSQSRSSGFNSPKFFAASIYRRAILPPPVITRNLLPFFINASITALNPLKNPTSTSSGTIKEPPREMIYLLLLAGIGCRGSCRIRLLLLAAGSGLKAIIRPFGQP